MECHKMFRLVIVCDDKKLVDTLRGIRGNARILEGPDEVINATMANGKLNAETGGKILEMFAQHLHKHKLKEINTRGAKDFLRGIGKSPASHGYMMKSAVKNGLVRRARKGPPSAGGNVFAVTLGQQKKG